MCVFAAVLALAAPALGQNTIYVSTISDPNEDGSQAHPFDTILEGITAADTGDIVEIADGTYTGADNKNLDFDGKEITVRSASGDPTQCVIDCENDGRGFYFHHQEGAAAVISGITIANGSGNVGAGIYCTGSRPTIQDCVIRDCIATSDAGGISCYNYSEMTLISCTISGNSASQRGGGIHCHYLSNPTLENCTISGNSAGWDGGGVYCWLSGPTLDNCTISANSSDGRGGGVYCSDSGYLNLTNCTISGNQSDDDGGGIYCNDSSPTLTHCTISGNSAGWDGGGVCCGTSNPTLENSIISGNSADWYGGGVYCSGSNPMLANCTISGNAANYSGGGVYCSGYDDAPTVTNCILWADTPEEVYVSSGNPVLTYCDVQNGTGETWFGEGCIDVDPLFTGGPMGCYYLAQSSAGQPTDSPCLDAGNDTATNLGLDTRFTRTDEVGDQGVVDMGYHCAAYDGSVPDCNGNAVADECDINSGCSGDCQSNGVPDECDIVLGDATDHNQNGVPDECESLGDLNCDGSTNLFDIDAFVLALTDEVGYDATYPDCDRNLADIDGSGDVNLFDIDPFVELLTAG